MLAPSPRLPFVIDARRCLLSASSQPHTTRTARPRALHLTLPSDINIPQPTVTLRQRRGLTIGGAYLCPFSGPRSPSPRSQWRERCACERRSS